MSNTIITKELLQKEVTKNLDKNASIFPIANRQYEWELKKQGQTVTVQQLPSFDMDQGITAWWDITAEDWAITSENLTCDQAMNKAIKILDIEDTRSNLDLASMLWWRLQESVNRAYDQFTAVTAVRWAITANRLVEGSPATESSSTAFWTVESFRYTTDQQNVSDNVFLFVNPIFKSFLRQSSLLDNTETWIWMRINWEVWRASDLRVIMTNNLPFKQKITLVTIPTAWDTFTITVWSTTITFTFVASWTAANAWEISIWANAAAAQANMVLAINWTWTPWATTYIDLSAANRKLLRNAFVQMTSFSSNVSYLTAWKYVLLAEVVTPADFVLWTASRVLFSMDNNAVNIARQLVWYKMTDAEKWFYKNVLVEDVYWWAVLNDNDKRIITKEIANWVTIA